MQPRTSVGRRKNAIARVKLIDGSGKITVNKREFEKYFPLEIQRDEIMRPFKVTDTVGRYDALIRVHGGGPVGQAGAVRLGIARSLVALDEDARSALRGAGLLTRDPRMVERKKYGQKKARKRFQFSKRSFFFIPSATTLQRSRILFTNHILGFNRQCPADLYRRDSGRRRRE